MYVDEPPKDGNIPDFNISKIEICPFRAYQRSFRLFQGNFSKDIHLRSRLLCFTQNDHTGQTGFKICPFLKWAQFFILMQYATKFLRMLLRRNLANDIAKLRIRKEKDFNITEFFRIRFVFLWNKACCFIIIRYLCTIYRISWISAIFIG